MGKQVKQRNVTRGAAKSSDKPVTLAGVVAPTVIPPKGKVSSDDRAVAIGLKQIRIASRIAEALGTRKELRAGAAVYSKTKLDKEMAPMHAARLLVAAFTDKEMATWPRYNSGATVRTMNKEGAWVDADNDNPWSFMVKRPTRNKKNRLVPRNFGDTLCSLIPYLSDNRKQRDLLNDSLSKAPSKNVPDDMLKRGRVDRQNEIDRLDTEYRDHKEFYVNGIRYWQVEQAIKGMKRPESTEAAIALSYARGPDGKSEDAFKPIVLTDKTAGEMERYSPTDLLGWNPWSAHEKGGSLAELRASTARGPGRQQQEKDYYDDLDEVFGVMAKLYTTFAGLTAETKAIVAKAHNYFDKVSADRDMHLLTVSDASIQINSFLAPHSRLVSVLNEQRAQASAASEDNFAKEKTGTDN